MAIILGTMIQLVLPDDDGGCFVKLTSWFSVCHDCAGNLSMHIKTLEEND